MMYPYGMKAKRIIGHLFRKDFLAQYVSHIDTLSALFVDYQPCCRSEVECERNVSQEDFSIPWLNYTYSVIEIASTGNTPLHLLTGVPYLLKRLAIRCGCHAKRKRL